MLWPSMVWGLAKGVKRAKTSKRAQLRSLFPGTLVVPAGWAWFMVPALRSWPQIQYDRRAYIPFVPVATPDGLRIIWSRSVGNLSS
ncbi:hypothetical protein ACVWWH_000768 [Sinomonas sp. RB5]